MRTHRKPELTYFQIDSTAVLTQMNTVMGQKSFVYSKHTNHGRIQLLFLHICFIRTESVNRKTKLYTQKMIMYSLLYTNSIYFYYRRVVKWSLLTIKDVELLFLNLKSSIHRL